MDLGGVRCWSAAPAIPPAPREPARSSYVVAGTQGERLMRLCLDLWLSHCIGNEIQTSYPGQREPARAGPAAPNPVLPPPALDAVSSATAAFLLFPGRNP
ncbi:hypothetical protein H1C71_006203 [Ictidomys tridecemlineatus]|nr:hypothetical protein H1C71_006203 [Ictidomys tridecemlineatus]